METVPFVDLPLAEAAGALLTWALADGALTLGVRYGNVYDEEAHARILAAMHEAFATEIAARVGEVSRLLADGADGDAVGALNKVLAEAALYRGGQVCCTVGGETAPRVGRHGLAVRFNTPDSIGAMVAVWWRDRAPC